MSKMNFTAEDAIKAAEIASRLFYAVKEKYGNVYAPLVVENFNRGAEKANLPESEKADDVIISRWMLGFALPNVAQMQVLADIIGVTTDFLWGGEPLILPPSEVNKVGKGHKYEILDRSHCLNVMFEETIATHPAAELMLSEIEAVRTAINALYQKAAAVRHDHKD